MNLANLLLLDPDRAGALLIAKVVYVGLGVVFRTRKDR
jgi:hypothetical protein